MSESRSLRNDNLSKAVIAGLESRNMKGYYAKNKEEALKLALSLIPAGSKIAKGGSASVAEIGLLEAVKTGEYNYIDREGAADKRQAELDSYSADIYLTSSNAVTYDGILVNIDGNANRVSAISYGPKKVIMIVGMNKVCPDIDSAMKRARNEAAPINATRLHTKTPCVSTGKCMDCKSPDSICCQFLITRMSRHTDRIHVILIDDALGF